MTDKSYSFTCIWSCRSMFGLNWMLRYIISHFYHLSVSETRSFWFSASILSAYMTFHRLKYVWGSGCERDRDIHSYKSYSFASILSESSMFGLHCISRYTISHIYHLSMSETKSIRFSSLILSSHATFHQLRSMGYCVWGVKRYP